MARLALLLTISCFAIVSCKKDEETRSNAKSILKFSVDTISVTIDESAHTVKLTVPYTFDLTAVKPVITISPEATISPASGATVNLSSQVVYKVKAADGSEQAYTVTATKRSSNSIESFVVTSGQTQTAVINDTTHTITLIGSFSYNVWTSCRPVIKVTSGATVSPASGEQVNLYLGPKYRVTGSDGKVQEYTVKLVNTDDMLYGLRAPFPSMNYFDTKDTFLAAHTGLITDQNIFIPEDLTGINTFYASLFYVTKSDDVSNVIFKTVKLPVGATASPSFDLPQDFSKDVVYTITSMAGTTSQTTVRAVKQNLVTPASGYPSIVSSFIGLDDFDLYYRISASAEIDKITLLQHGGAEFAAKMLSDEVDANGIHHAYIKSETALPLGSYRAKFLFKDGSSQIDNYLYNKW